MNGNFEDLFKLYDIENGWKDLYKNYFLNEIVDESKFLSLIKETHEYFIPTCEEKSIPKTMIDILLSIHAFSTDKLYISNECETYKLIANGLLQAIICNIHIERYKKGEFDVEINNRIICFDVNKPDIKSILKEVSKVGF